MATHVHVDVSGYTAAEEDAERVSGEMEEIEALLLLSNKQRERERKSPLGAFKSTLRRCREICGELTPERDGRCSINIPFRASRTIRLRPLTGKLKQRFLFFFFLSYAGELRQIELGWQRPCNEN